MSEAVITFDHVWKKFNRGQRFNSLRDLVPAMVSGLVRRRNDQLSKQEFWALQDVSFTVRPGEALGIIGPNGAGKSTALKVLTKLLRADKGKATVRGRVGALVEIAAGFHPDLTGRENVFMQGAIMGMRRAEILSKFDDIVDFAGVKDFIDTPVKRYSSGMNARLGFAVAAHLDPDVLLIDEVLSVGDLSFQDRCYERMQRFVRSGIAVVFVSHNLAAISSLCDQVLVLRQGRVQTLAATHDAITVYANLVQEAQIAAVGGHEVMIQLQDSAGLPMTNVAAGAPLTVRVVAQPAESGELLHGELQVRHLESGTFVYRCQSRAAGADSVIVPSGERLEIVWSLRANLGRGHYGISCAIVNQQHRWLATSAAAMLTVNEPKSEQALAHLDAECVARVLEPGSLQLAPAIKA